MNVEVDVTPLPVPPSRLGESPFWHVREQALYWCDITGRTLNRFDPAAHLHDAWPLPSEPGCCVPLLEGGLLLGLRSGLHRFDPASGACERLAPPPYDPARLRFNDGKADPLGRLWVGTLDERKAQGAALYRYGEDGFERMVDGADTANGLAWSVDARTLYWADTPTHRVQAFDFDVASGALSNRRVFAAFAARVEGKPYGGRPDGAAVDVEGGYWVAMYEGARLLRFAPDGTLDREIELPVQCPTMPCFGGPDLRTIYVTSACDKRSAAELAVMPWSGAVLRLDAGVAGLPAHFATLG